MEKILKTILGLFILLSLILPLSKGIPKIDLKWPTEKINTKYTNNLADNLNKQVENLAQDNLRELIVEILKEIGIKNEKIEIFMDTTQDSCISINKCKVYIPKDTKKTGSNNSLTNADLLDISKDLEKKLNIKMEVYIQN